MDVVVRFEWELKVHGREVKEFFDVEGRFQSQTKVSAITPDLSEHKGETPLGQGKCKVRVALDGGSFTLTTADFYFHSVTEHHKCLIFGPGVLEHARDPLENKLATLEETLFVIQAKDEKNKNRTTGGDEFEVTIKLKVGPLRSRVLKKEGGLAMGLGGRPNSHNDLYLFLEGPWCAVEGLGRRVASSVFSFVGVRVYVLVVSLLVRCGRRGRTKSRTGRCTG